MDWTILFDGWGNLGRTATVGVLAYVSLVLLIRISGKRTLAKMNAFDLVVTVALGSTLASILLSKDVALAEGITALGVLIGMQYLVAWSSVRSGFIRRLARSEPRLLVHKGRVLEGATVDERVSRDEVLSAIRSQGLSGLNQTEAVVLETDGSFSVISTSSSEEGGNRALEGVRGFPE
jgi:uncharacterized membrane protein YcaP (DUF421 family)